MKEFKRIMPESKYSLDNFMSNEKLARKLTLDDFVVGKVVYFDAVNRQFKVSLGNGFMGIMPISEASIYPTLHPDGRLTAEAYSIVGRIVCVKIAKIQPNKIVVSRKANMIDAFKTISNMENQIVDCYVKTCQKTMFFLDIGHGISGMIHVGELCTSRIDHVLDIGIKEKDYIKAIIKSFDSEKFHVNMGYKELFEDVSGKFNRDDLIEVISFHTVQTSNGYFAYVNPNTTAILDPLSDVPIPYGTRVVARVKSSAPNKLKLGFMTFV